MTARWAAPMMDTVFFESEGVDETGRKVRPPVFFFFFLGLLRSTYLHTCRCWTGTALSDSTLRL